jgi:hypothetical protein
MSNDVTQLLSTLGQGAPHAASRLLSLVYEELRKLAAQRMAQEQPRRTKTAAVSMAAGAGLAAPGGVSFGIGFSGNSTL